ncbi:right-handed parallel beta-helix repeat-containing protein [Bacillus albus]|uniref:right-handed parallel beta-helix repeat-containing protein n=1 Tax=Bacillus albus TaxID=2026189 RepID=UPI0030156C7D
MTSEEIQEMINSLPEEGGEIRIPVGIHQLSSPIRLPANKSIRLVGHGAASELRAGFSSNPVVFIGSDGGGDRRYSKDISHLKLSRSPEYLKPEDSNAIGLLVDSVAYITIHNIHLTHQNCGIKIQGDSANATILDCWFLLNIQEGIRIAGGANYTVERCFIEPSGIGLYLDQCEAVWARDCKIINGGGYEYGIVVRGKRHTDFNLIQCNLEGARHSAIFFEDGIDRSSIKDCWIGVSIKRPDGGGGNGIKLNPGCSRIYISQNRIGDQHGAAIEMYRADRVVIEDNLFDGNGLIIEEDVAVIELSNSKEIYIRRNRFEGGRAIAGLRIGKFGGESVSVFLQSDNDFSQFSGEKLLEE